MKKRSKKMQEDSWELPYIGRKVNSKYDSYFDHNGFYPSDYDNDYLEEGIILNIKCSVSEGCIDFIDYYKVCEECGGPGRPSAYDESLDRRDIRWFEKILDKCTIPICEGAIDEISSIVEGKPDILNPNWESVEVDTESFILKKDDDEVIVPKKLMERLMDLALVYADVLTDEKFWNVNKKTLDIKYKEACLSLFSLIDVEKYLELYS